MTPQHKSRRRFLLSGAGAAGMLIVGWGALAPRQRLRGSTPLPVRDGAVALNGWVAIAPDNSVSVVVARAEMGQGVHTALPMLVAEELDVPLDSVRVVPAPPGRIYANAAAIRDSLPFHPDDHGTVRALAEWLLTKAGHELGIVVTGASTSVRDAWQPMREAGAVARGQLVAAASRAWRLPPQQIRTEAGHLVHDSSGRRASYGSFARAAAQEEPFEPALKEPHAFKLIGRNAPRRDSRIKSDGTARFGIDARPPGMLYAALRMCPHFGGRIAGISPADVLALPGVLSVIDFTGALHERAGAQAGVAVVAHTFWQARQAAAALAIRWDAGPHGTLSSEEIRRDMAAALDREDGTVYRNVGDVAEASEGATPLHAEYSVPFLAHATMEPVNCTAQVADGKVRLWLSTQAPSMVVAVAAGIGGVAAGDVELHEHLLGGGFGRRLETDMVAQAVAIARECQGRPVQVTWTREEDIGHDVYRPAALARYAATLDAAGNLLSWRAKSASGSMAADFMARNFGLPMAGPDRYAIEGAYDLPYEIPHQHVVHVTVPSAVPLGAWRSVGHSHHAFFKESFIDEMAHAAGKDPVGLRRAMLLAHPRHLAVLDAAVAKAGQPRHGRAHGVALHESFGSIVAQVAEVSVRDGAIRVHRVVCVIDCGLAVNPSLVAQQMESAVIFGLSAALAGEITIRDGKVEQSNFGDYPVLRMNEAPQVETTIMLSAELPQGVGEPGVPPVAPAVANAVFTLTGQRLRSLPLRLA